MIPNDQVENLKRLFAEDGLPITDAQALEIGLWLLRIVKAVAQPIANDKMDLYVNIKAEVEAVRRAAPFVNLFECRKGTSSDLKDAAD